MALDPVLSELAKTQRLLRVLLSQAEGDGASASHLAVLEALSVRPGLTGADLARVASITPQAMNELARRLEIAGEVTRGPHAIDKRKIGYEITSEGRAAIKASRTARRRLERELESAWPVERQDALVDQLRATNADLEAALRPAGEPAPDGPPADA